MSLPFAYQWLQRTVSLEGGHPRMVAEALKLFGVHESAGPGDNPEILGWAKEAGVSGYLHDQIPWCGLFMAIVAFRSGKSVPASPLWALNWVNFGREVRPDSPSTWGPGAASLGDVLVFIRPGGGHVGLYVGEDAAAYHVLGGNESDQVEITRILKSRLHAWRRPIYGVMPKNVLPVKLAPTGAIGATEV